jgi:hypothetical protein
MPNAGCPLDRVRVHPDQARKVANCFPLAANRFLSDQHPDAILDAKSTEMVARAGL